jgi:hypothetical protein
MPFIVKTRYGAQAKYPHDADISSIVESLINGLETYRFMGWCR